VENPIKLKEKLYYVLATNPVHESLHLSETLKTPLVVLPKVHYAKTITPPNIIPQNLA